jgi:hypothetical protein
MPHGSQDRTRRMRHLGTCVRVRAVAAPALLVRSHRPRLAAPPPPPRPTPPQGRAAMPRMAPARVCGRDLDVNRTGRTWRMLPMTSPSAGRRPTSTSCAGPATAPRTVPSPSCAARSAMPAAATPPSAGMIDSCSITASHPFLVLADWTPPRRSTASNATSCGHPGPAGGRAGHCCQCAGSGAVPWLLARARYRYPRLGPSVGRPGLYGGCRAGREQDPAVRDPDRRQIKPKGGLITQPRRWVVERTFAWMHRCRRLTRQYEQTPLAMRPWSSSARSRSRSAASTERPNRHNDGVVQQALGGRRSRSRRR